MRSTDIAHVHSHCWLHITSGNSNSHPSTFIARAFTHWATSSPQITLLPWHSSDLSHSSIWGPAVLTPRYFRTRVPSLMETYSLHFPLASRVPLFCLPFKLPFPQVNFPVSRFSVSGPGFLSSVLVLQPYTRLWPFNLPILYPRSP